MLPKILFVDDEESLCFSYKTHLRKAGYEVAIARDFQGACELLAAFDPNLIVADIILGGGYTGIDLLREVRAQGKSSPVIMITGEPNVQTAMEAVRLGAYDYLAKPFRKEKLLNVIGNALREKEIADEKDRYQQNLNAVFRSIKDGIVTVDNNMVVIEANHAIKQICDIVPDHLIGQDLRTVPMTCSQACLEAIDQTLVRKTAIVDRRVECRHEKFPGKVVMLSSSCLKRGDSPCAGVVLVIRDVTRLSGLERELRERYGFHQIIGKSPRMQDLYNLLEILSDTDTTVLIGGESGTGKELVAKALHHQGIRRGGPLVTVDCSCLSESLLESELFGHTKGAFTGADKDKSGRFQLAHGGTLFLDEIGNISHRIQQKILRFLQEKEIEKVGGARAQKVDVRIIAATNVDLKEMVATGRFREDLYYRLKVMEVALPPLRERREDIPLLVEHFIKMFNKKMSRRVDGVSQEVMDVFMTHTFPGNVRELEHALEHAFILCRGPVITLDHLPADIRGAEKSRPHGRQQQTGSKQQLLQTLEETDWNVAKAARKLGISRRTLYRKIGKYKIRRPDE